KWNGTGYPNGLSRENIPLSARIVAIADVFDALTSERPYKKAWSIEKAAKLIKEESGKHFDPSLVVHFLNFLPEFEEIADNNRD
ncbi:MAG: HD domain-containing phosphohydrolase, partial [Moritella sp.]|uniref:HD-GYP domain-containing protein n=1 Tax=Moritella sp. TaxID=78556 RepID=UPI0029AF1D33